MVATDELTMTDGERLLRRILECPEDDAPRLIYSDWLEEQGRDASARFVRSQIWKDTARTVPLSYIDPVIERIMGVQPHQMSNSGCKVEAIVAATGQSTTLAIYRRGFVKEVRLTCAAFVGGRCEACGGRGVLYQTMPPDSCGCPECGGTEDTSGTGRIEGVASELFQRHPITGVRLVDKKPHSDDRNPTCGWWPEGFLSAHGTPHDIPKELHDNLRDWEPTPRPFNNNQNGWRFYKSESDANAALSRACVAYGRQLAGLPPLTPAQSPPAGT